MLSKPESQHQSHPEETEEDLQEQPETQTLPMSIINVKQEAPDLTDEQTQDGQEVLFKQVRERDSDVDQLCCLIKRKDLPCIFYCW